MSLARNNVTGPMSVAHSYLFDERQTGRGIMATIGDSWVRGLFGKDDMMKNTPSPGPAHTAAAGQAPSCAAARSRHLYLAYSVPAKAGWRSAARPPVAPAGRNPVGRRGAPRGPERRPASRVDVQDRRYVPAPPPGRWGALQRACWQMSFGLRNLFSRLMRLSAPSRVHPAACSPRARVNASGRRRPRPDHIRVVRSPGSLSAAPSSLEG
jgi:hypothetical protein